MFTWAVDQYWRRKNHTKRNEQMLKTLRDFKFV